MKKLLSLLGVVSLTATGTTSLVACGAGKPKAIKQSNTSEGETLVQQKEQKPVNQTPEKEQIMNISLSSMKELSDRKVRGVPFFNFKLPMNLYNDLEVDNLSKKTQKEKTIIFDSVESFIKNFVKEKINEKILEINNSLTKKDYDIIFLYPDSMRKNNPRYKSIAMDFTVEGKNKATGQVTQKLTVDVTTYNNNY